MGPNSIGSIIGFYRMAPQALLPAANWSQANSDHFPTWGRVLWALAEEGGQARNARRRKEAEQPLLPVLREAIGACPSGHLTSLVTSFDKSSTANGFGNWF